MVRRPPSSSLFPTPSLFGSGPEPIVDAANQAELADGVEVVVLRLVGILEVLVAVLLGRPDVVDVHAVGVDVVDDRGDLGGAVAAVALGVGPLHPPGRRRGGAT